MNDGGWSSLRFPIFAEAPEPAVGPDRRAGGVVEERGAPTLSRRQSFSTGAGRFKGSDG
jgi:hypothetical protein